ncbi:energy transducer TonB [Hymenobacter fodinae]|uniref:Energy transducer TonB n=1 Tax=Hymenobacter fodinae TaxID=2510796 RepID=A0A4Z0P093_9BACT|nr:energy transducer TonB [Hymenobacter fodinae]TGE03803.1 energy transducer TonB [Hymenobacter fodinae]
MLRTFTLVCFLLLAAADVIGQALTVTTSPVANETGTGGAVAASPKVYETVDEMPTYPGGAPAFLKFLQTKLKYPEEALHKNINGKVFVSFVVDEQGRILDPTVVRGLGAGLDQEALRLVRIMPWWTPGRLNGQPVRVAYTLPITFKLLD